MAELTVLEKNYDPFRIDTPSRHRDGVWLANTSRDLGLGDRTIHLRGLHYMVIGRPKPDGTPYTNTAADWLWLVEHAGKAARWLGYIPFDQIVDQRNSPPEVTIFESPVPWHYITVGLDVWIPEADDITPQVTLADFAGTQPYKLVMVGEKSSLHDVLAPLAQAYKADLYLPTGEMSSTHVYQMAKIGAEDGRPMVVLYFSDADPSGWQMPISVGRKLQAFQALQFPDLDFEVHRVALRPDQVRRYDLPSTPLKATEKRGDKWRALMGTEQTEIDALASLRPELLHQIAAEALDNYFDHGLEGRVAVAGERWLVEAQASLDGQLDAAWLARIRAEAEVKLGSVRAQLAEINDSLRIDASEFDLPVPEIPTAVVSEEGWHAPLLDSRWSFAEQTLALKESKAYVANESAGGAR